MASVKVLVVDGCEPCAELKEALKEPIEAGEVRLVDGMSDEGQKLLQGHPEIDHVPYAFTEEQGKLRKCDIRRSDDGSMEINCD